MVFLQLKVIVLVLQGLFPTDVRIYGPEEDGKTKNDHFREMVVLLKKQFDACQKQAAYVVMNAWYTSRKKP